MEIRTLPVWLVVEVLFFVALGSSSDIQQDLATLTNTTGHEAAKPEFINEPKDILVLPNFQALLLCEVKFVSKLKFNCSGGLIPKEIYLQQNNRNVTKLIADVSHVMIKPGALDGDSCVCKAIGYSGTVIRSQAAAVKKAYLGENFKISPSRNTRVPKSSLVVLRCQPPIGVPSPVVSWRKDGFPVHTHKDGRVEVTNQANLSLVLIRNAQTSDAGDYSCIASNPVGIRQSAIIKLNVYVNGGWSTWQEFSPCSVECGNGTRMMKRFCSNPPPQNGGQFCAGLSFKRVPCQDICPDVEIICPNDTVVYVNRSDIVTKIVSWNQPRVINKKNGTKFSVHVIPPWAVPPVELTAASKVYVITYMVKHEFGQTANCSFNLTVFNATSSACFTTEHCRNAQTTSEPSPGDQNTNEAKGSLTANPITIAVAVVVLVVILVAIIALVSRFTKSRHMQFETKASAHEFGRELDEGSFKRATLDSTSPLILHSSSYSELGTGAFYEKLRAGSPTIQDYFIDFPLPLKEPPKTEHVVQADSLKPIEVEIVNEQRSDKRRGYNRTNSSVSNKSTASEISRMMWNISNLPENADPKMVAWGLVDHNGGKFTIGNTGVSLSVPPQAIPEGHTEGIFIAIMNQEKEHPQVTAKESLLSPVVKCGPNGLKFKRPVILTMPHCALLEEGAWNLKVQYNESDPGTPADWKQLIDVNKQDGSDPHLALVEQNMVHLMVDHFTDFAVTGESASNEQAKKTVRIVAYATPPEADGDCVVRVYCVGDTPVHLESVHSQETERLGGETRDAPKPFHFRDGGGDLLVNLTAHHLGWTNTSGDHKKIRFEHVWEGIERMPNRTFVFALAGESVPQFRATFEVKQDCQDGDEEEVIVSTGVKQTPRPIEKSESNNKATEQGCTCAAPASLPKAASVPCLEDTTAAVLHAGSFGNPWQSSSQTNILLGACAGSGLPASPHQLKHTSSGYFSFGFEPLSSADSLSSRIRNELIIILDPPHLTADWRTLAENVGFEMKHIRFLENLKPASPTAALLAVLESKKYPLHELAEKLHEIGRDDAADLIEAQLMLRETEV